MLVLRHLPKEVSTPWGGVGVGGWVGGYQKTGWILGFWSDPPVFFLLLEPPQPRVEPLYSVCCFMA